MEISRLLKKRQLNVQEQNAIAEYRLLSIAKYWHEHPIPPALFAYGKEQGILWSGTIVLELEIDFPGMPSLFGRILTNTGRFIEFELETDNTHEKLLSVEQWEDVTNAQNFSEHNKGKGIGHGAIAMKIQNQLCGET
ncbi:hypothetical protein [Stutzerimonas nitrititolerans]|uniref:hypothetical protein n=1 Tax=Stutzerimonas nitrititolerans TaxID=2482751 RepID=UPI0028B00F70|nr:hypothetical protein [Stutzerimonas nitrititolerans]